MIDDQLWQAFSSLSMSSMRICLFMAMLKRTQEMDYFYLFM